MGQEYEYEGFFVDAVDKGKSAIITLQVNTYLITEGKKELACIVHTSLYLKGLGGFGFKGTNALVAPNAPPKRTPDRVLKVSTYPSQAFLYRLSGDRNPLHIDPKVAKGQGFPNPILHGMCTYGSVARTIIQEIFNNNEKRFG